MPARIPAADALNTDAARAFLEQGQAEPPTSTSGEHVANAFKRLLEQRLAEPATSTPGEPRQPSARKAQAINEILRILGEDEPQA